MATTALWSYPATDILRGVPPHIYITDVGRVWLYIGGDKQYVDTDITLTDWDEWRHDHSEYFPDGKRDLHWGH